MLRSVQSLLIKVSYCKLTSLLRFRQGRSLTPFHWLRSTRWLHRKEHYFGKFDIRGLFVSLYLKCYISWKLYAPVLRHGSATSQSTIFSCTFSSSSKKLLADRISALKHQCFTRCHIVTHVTLNQKGLKLSTFRGASKMISDFSFKFSTFWSYPKRYSCIRILLKYPPQPLTSAVASPLIWF